MIRLPQSLRLTATLASLGIAAIDVAGCSSGASAPRDGGAASVPPETVALTPWRLRLVTECPGATPEKCVGAYGFTVSSDGRYEIGPAPEGDLLSGALEEAELQAMRALVDGPAASCEPTVDAKGCDPAIRSSLLELAAKYYPPSFPNACISAALDLERSFGKLSRCEQDSDCAVIGEDFLPVDERTHRPLPVDDCAWTKPLVVANAFEAVANQLKLVLKNELVQRICGKELKRPGCAHPSYFKPDTDPRCIAGTCTIQSDKGA